MIGFLAAGAAADGPASAPASRPAVANGEILGERFESQASGIAFRPPARCEMIRRRGIAEEVVQYRDEKRMWTLNVRRMSLPTSQPLVAKDDPATPNVDESKTQPGLLETTVRQLVAQTVGAAQVIRQDVIRIDDKVAGDKKIPVGMLAYRYTDGPQRWFRQQALVEANDQLYYVFDFVTPTAKAPDAPEEQVDQDELFAAETFGLVIKTVQLLDRHAIVADQQQRLIATRTLLVNFTPERIKSKLMPESYYRLLRRDKDGQWTDIGYSYIVEEPANRSGNEGVIVAVRSFTRPEENYTREIVAESFASFDLKHEVWANLSLGNDQKANPKNEFWKKNITRELGTADAGITGKRFSLRVEQFSSKADQPPVEKELPPFYLPQTMGALLPRLLPANDTRAYAFGTWVGSEREVMMRYIDVEHPRDENIAGQRITVVPIKDRIGVDGIPTYHFLTMDGKYLGSRNDESGSMVLLSDRETVKKRWPEGTMERPFVIDKPLPGRP